MDIILSCLLLSPVASVYRKKIIITTSEKTLSELSVLDKHLLNKSSK